MLKIMKIRQTEQAQITIGCGKSEGFSIIKQQLLHTVSPYRKFGNR
jgi:hypothetical protein